jgi:hypothetical protein
MTLTPWQRSTILGAFNYLKELARTKDPRAEMLAQGLAEVLEPSRRTIRLQREAAQAAAAGAAAGHERRTRTDRRRPATDRRQKEGPFEAPDRRVRQDRRDKHRRGTSS